jgi:hypothetical protein
VDVSHGPNHNRLEALTRMAAGTDIERELELCSQLASDGGAASVKSMFDGARAVRLFQALLWTGRVHEMSDLWRQSVELAVQRGSLAPPEWN